MSDRRADRRPESDATAVAGETTPTTHLGEGLAPAEVLAGRWEIEAVLGSGGMGTVYRARDLELGETVALKVLKPGLGDDAIERFRREVRLARRVTHKNIARVHELGEHQGRRFFTMERVDGESLGDLMDRTGRLPLAQLVDIATNVIRGLAAAHDVGVVHRDLKPDNVLMGKDGRVALTDFGIAAPMDVDTGAAATTSFAGTPLYMAPEQVDRKHAIGPRADLYAFGAMLYEMATGEPPFSGETPLATAVARLSEEPVDPRRYRADLPDALVDLIRRCMARKPEGRPACAEDVERMLQSVMSEPAGPPSLAAWGVPSPEQTTKRLAVLSISNAGEADGEYLADGIAEDLIDHLSTIRRLQVLSRGATSRFRDTTAASPTEIGAALGVDVLAEGTLRRIANDKHRLSIRLISASTGAQIWSKRTELGSGDVLEATEAIAHEIAQALTVEAPRADRKLSAPAAVDLYLRARAAARQFSPEGARASADLFEQALACQPDDPLLVSGYALALSRLGFFFGEHRAAADLAAQRAVALAPDSGEAHLAAASAALHVDRPAQALQHALKAVALSPSLAEAHQTVGRVLAESGPLELAARFLKTALELEPQQMVTVVELSRTFNLLGRWDEALKLLGSPDAFSSEQIGQQIAYLRIMLWQRDPDLIAQARQALSKVAEAIAPTSPVRASTAREFVAMLDPANDLFGHARALPMSKPPTRRDVFLSQITAEIAALRGDEEATLLAVSRGVEAGLRDLMWLERCPLLEPVRADSRYVELHRELTARSADVRAVLPPELTAAGSIPRR